jgi:hypothetical protein
LHRANVRVHLMATDAAVGPDNPVRRIVEKTGGTIVTEADPRLWVRGLRTLLRGVTPRYLEERVPLRVTFTEAGPALAEMDASPWNRTWLKRSATELASGHVSSANGSSIAADDPVPAAAAWFSGNGAVIAVAFRADRNVVTTLSERVAMPPRDPRFKVAWDSGPRLVVTLDAAEGDRPINGLAPQLELLPGEPLVAAIVAAAATTNPSRTLTPIPQVAPGRYRLDVPAPLRPMHAAVRIDGHAIDRIAVAARYPPEFDGIGNDRAAIRELARSTGGAVIEPGQTARIDFQWPVRRVSLSSWLAACGVILLGAGAVVWKRGH